MESRIFLSGDTHGWKDIHKFNKRNFPTGETLDKKDIVMIAGDAGFVWNSRTDNRKIEWITKMPWTTVVVPGNHENYILMQEYPIVEFYGAKAYKISDSLYYIQRGEIMEIEGKTFLCFSGAFSHDIAYRRLGYDWFREELPTQKEVDNCLENLRRYNYKVDYVVTHDVPLSYNILLGYHGVDLNDMEYYKNDEVAYIDICSFLQNLYEMIIIRYTWFAGHYHVNCRINNLQILFDDIVELADNKEGYMILKNIYQKTMNRTFSREELKKCFVEEDLYLNWQKVGTYFDFGARDPVMKGKDFFDESVTDSELQTVTYLYNLYTVQKDTIGS